MSLHIGATISDGKLFTTVMKQDDSGCVAVLATAQMEVNKLQGYDIVTKMTPEPDPQLCHFYGVTTYPELVEEMENHIRKLQQKLPVRESINYRVREG